MKNFDKFINRDDKFKVFENFESITEYVETVGDFIELFKYITDEEKYKVNGYEISLWIKKMDTEDKKVILNNRTLLNTLNVSEEDISEILVTINDVIYVENYMENNVFSNQNKFYIMKSFSDEYKMNAILNKTKGMFDFQIKSLISSLNSESLCEFIENNRDFFNKNHIAIYEIFEYMKFEKISEIVYSFDKLNIPEEDKKKILIMLNEEYKEKLDKNKIDSKLLEFLELKPIEKNKLIPDFDRDLSIYKGLDEILYINPFEKEYELEDIVKLSKICPNIKISDMLNLEKSTLEEYIEGESWINNVLSQINPEWTDIQKLAYIDNQIGKKISYTPNFDTEMENQSDERCCWKIISSGYGVCNGVSIVEKYMLKKVGIESEIINSKDHSFLKIKNIEIPTEKGMVKGDTLVDPTWNLAEQRYNARPNFFCVSYKKIREADIDVNGVDLCSHKVEELEKNSDNLISLEDKYLREVYKSIGLLRDDNAFPIRKLVNAINEIDKSSYGIKEQLKQRINAIKSYCPDYYECINSTMKILQCIVFRNSEKFDYNRCIVSRVYDKNDANKNPVLFTYFDFGQEQKIFYYADKETKNMVPLKQEDFEKRFECYEKDKERFNNKNMWDYDKSKKNEEKIDVKDSISRQYDKDDIIKGEREK